MNYLIDLNKINDYLSSESFNNKLTADKYIKSEERLFLRKIKKGHWGNIKKAIVSRLETVYDGCKNATNYHIKKSLDEFKLKNMAKYDPEELEEFTKEVLSKCVIFVDKQTFINNVINEIENNESKNRFIEMFTLDTKYYKKVRPVKFWQRLVQVLLVVGTAAMVATAAKGHAGLHGYADHSMFAHDVTSVADSAVKTGKSYSTTQILDSAQKKGGQNPYFTFTTDMPKRFLSAVTLAIPNLKYRVGVKIDIKLID